MAIENYVTVDNMVGKWAIGFGQFQNKFELFVTEKQREVLESLMGYELYNDFNTNTTEQKWQDLINGKTYTDCYGNVNNWKGLTYMLTPYMYSVWIPNNRFNITSTGTIQADNQNSVTPSDLQQKNLEFTAFNEFVKRYNEAYLFMTSNDADYNEIETYHRIYRRKGITTKTSIR